MNEINSCPPMKVKVLGPTEFSVGDTTQFSDYTSGGFATQVEMPNDIKFKPFKESMMNPDFVVSDFAKVNRPAQLHLGFQALHAFERFYSRLPRPRNKADAKTVVKLAKKLNTTMATPVEAVDDELITKLSCVSAGSLCPMQAVIGSIAAQEVLKACSGKFNPIQQWFYFDAFECLPQDADVEESDANAMEYSRYAGQARVFGVNVQELLMTQRYFVVSYDVPSSSQKQARLSVSKFAMMGIGVDDGCIYVSDNAFVQRSDLNTQFLLRSPDVGALKSVMAGQTIVELNQDINIAVCVDEVCPETNICTDDFFESLDGVAIAVDNAETRHFMDRCCVHYGKALIDSGIMATKGSVQVVVPHIIKNYSASQDPPDESVPADTIKYFPSNIEHILLWAREEFKVLFEQSASNADQYIKLRFQEQYNDQIRQLLCAHPENQITTSGAPFWSGHKRCPHQIQFDPKNTLHMDYIVAAANLRAAMYGLAHNTDREEIADMLESVEVPALGPQNEGVQEAAIDANPPQTDVPQPDDDNVLAKLLEELRHAKRLVDVPLSKMEFNTEDDKNFHVDFIVAAANLRASSYNIEPAGRLKSKLIAGKIMPAIVTTTSLVAGLASLKLYKVAQRHDEPKLYKNGFVNLALPFFSFAEPVAPIKKKNNHKVNIVELSEGSRTLYATSQPSSASRLELSMSELVEAVSQQEIDPDKRFLVFDLKCRDVNGRDVELPRVRYELSRNEDGGDAKMADGREQE
ncbi:hypothetical protein HPB52_002155 [Rhipicephalus sanguineus]|uniref:Ubiquitin-activating enzyme E1 C-terminal domain-containing protein n=1 Tax=Rhipicephalus sanguineus TaxID=34632 RepID=A0A9D4Q3V3_RHISA|nr:hypothetical protein HPB52_002155 [Rhipicephalus sanguineus]